MRNYFAVLLRTLQRERLYAAINIAGLSLGVACCLILGLYLRSELTYDRYHVNHERIYRIVNEFTLNGMSDRTALTSRTLGPMLMADYPQIKAVVRFQSNAGNSSVAIHHANDTYYWANSYFVDTNIFDVFTHRIIYGDPHTLKDVNNIAVSETFARKYFGNANPIGEIVSTDSGIPTRIGAVFEDPPANTHLKYDILFSGDFSFLRDPDSTTLRRQSLWGINSFTYLLTSPDFDPKSWPRINDEFYKRYMEDLGKSVNQHWRSWLQPLTSTHLQNEVGEDLPNGNRIYLYGCSAVALFILLVACINYMNLATARATRRARSVGIRKILGASRLTLALQFLGEAVLFALIAVVLGVVVVEVVLRFTPIDSLLGGQVSLNLMQEPALAAWLLGLGVLLGVIAGSYPALYLSSWAPLSALTGAFTPGKTNLRVREALVLVQFTISAAVIALTLLMAAQMRYIANRSLGFQKENRLVVTLRGVTTIEQLPTIRAELAKNAHILGIAEASAMPGDPMPTNLVQIDSNTGVMQTSQIEHMPIGEDFVPVMGLKVVQGRDFSKHLLTDVGTNWLVNGALVRAMGWTEPLGKRIALGNQSGRVIGVVEDFNFKSLHSPIEAFAMSPLVDDFSGVPPAFQVFQQRLLVLNIAGSEVGATLDFVEKVMAKIDPKHPFEYTFLDDALDKAYKSERQLMRLIGIFAVVCIFIACLGLFGLSAFTTEQRTREIAMRKVLGAATWQIITLLARRILVLVLVAAALAAVIAYFGIDEWLTGFAYRARINPLIFVLAATTAALVAFVTVALQSHRTASANPVEGLRHVE